MGDVDCFYSRNHHQQMASALLSEFSQTADEDPTSKSPIRLDFLCTCLLCFCALATVILTPGTIEPGFAGLVLTYGLTLNLVVIASVTNQSILANDIISMERVNQYMYTEPEALAIIEDSRPAENWPRQGKIEFSQFAGAIETKHASCSEGHHMLSIIPQELALFRGTVRFNLDPLGDYSDHEVWNALDKCQLGHVIRSRDGKLDFKVKFARSSVIGKRTVLLDLQHIPIQ
ncbi:hypothetical protein R1flu_016235 [Riccia fluitans]|uniref:Uncharacterized protein n=1 Tax=Riccia fluitans TaxID=41844 RepID=A0ABD1YLA3_9MARC